MPQPPQRATRERRAEPQLPKEPTVAATGMRDIALGAAVALAAAVLYARTAPHDIVLGDTPEFMVDAKILGVAHAPGYPLLTMLGTLFTNVPIDTLPFRLDLLAVLCSAGAVFFVYLTALRLTRQPLASAGAAALLAVNALFWSWANVLETFPLNDLLAAALLYLVVLWQERPTRARWLIAGAFVAGLGMTNHQTIGLLAPAVLYLLWRQWRFLARNPQVVLACVGAFAVGLLPYLYVPWAASRNPAFNWQDVHSFGDLIALISRQSYGSTDLIPTSQYRGGPVLLRVGALAAAFGPAGVLVLIGFAAAFRHVRWYAITTLLAFLMVGPLFALISNVNLTLPFALAILERFFLLSLVVTAPLVAFGLVALADLVARLVPSRPAWASGAVLLAGLLSAIVLGYSGFGVADRSGYHAARNFGEDILSSLEANTLLFAGGDEVVLPLAYLQLVEQKRPDVHVIMLGMINADWYLRQLRQRYPDLHIPFARYVGQRDAMKVIVTANQGRPMALVGVLPDDSLKDGYWFLSHGLVLQIVPLSLDVTLDELESANARLFGLYRAPAQSDLRPGSLDTVIATNYAQAAFRVGLEYDNVQVYDGARRWYERALALDPGYEPATQRLTALPK